MILEICPESAWMQTVVEYTLFFQLLSQRNREKNVRGLNLPESLPFLVVLSSLKSTSLCVNFNSQFCTNS